MHRPTSAAATILRFRAGDVQVDQVGHRGLVLLVDGDALGGAGCHRPAPVPLAGHRVQHAAYRGRPELRAAEGDRVGAQPPGDLVDHDLVGHRDLSGVNGPPGRVRDRHRDLGEGIGDQPEVVGHLLGHLEHRLHQPGPGRRQGEPGRAGGVTDAVVELQLRQRGTVFEGQQPAAERDGADLVVAGRPEPAVLHVIGPGPHDAHRSPDRPGHLDGLDRGFVVEPAPERATGGWHVHGDRRRQHHERGGQLVLRVDRRL